MDFLKRYEVFIFKYLLEHLINNKFGEKLFKGC